MDTTSVSGRMRSNMYSSLLMFVLAFWQAWWCRNCWVGILASSQASQTPRSRQAFSTPGCSSESCMADNRLQCSTGICRTLTAAVQYAVTADGIAA